MTASNQAPIEGLLSTGNAVDSDIFQRRFRGGNPMEIERSCSMVDTNESWIMDLIAKMVSQMSNMEFSILAEDGRFWVVTDSGERRSKRMTRRELDNAIKRSASAVRIAEAVGQEADPLLKMVSQQPISGGVSD